MHAASQPLPTARHAPPADSAARGGKLRVSLACPRCDHLGWIAWENLGRAMRCAACRCEFQLGKLGKLELRPAAPLIRYECPRCRQARHLPAGIAVRGIQCHACQLMLVVGDDQQLHGEQETNARRGTANRASRSARSERHGLVRQSRNVQLACLAALVVVVSLGCVAAAMFGARSTAADVEAFTRECLAGDWADARRYLADDDIQRAEFDRWRVQHFSSILDKHRPKNDRLTISVELHDETAGTKAYRVTLTSPLIGTRVHEQLWCCTTGRWYFDARATLAAQQSSTRAGDGTRANRPPRDARQIKVPGRAQSLLPPRARRR